MPETTPDTLPESTPPKCRGDGTTDAGADVCAGAGAGPEP